MKRLLLINPWIYDFAAFDFWMKPLGLLYLAGHLRQHGYHVDWIDCLDRHNPNLLKQQGRTAPHLQPYGVGKFFRRRIPKPPILQDMQQHYCRYGIPENIFLDLLAVIPTPDAILITSMMTYWYPGVFRAIELAQQSFPGVPVVLGGVYATLCRDHAAQNSHADLIIQEHDIRQILCQIDAIAGFHSRNEYQPSSMFEVYPAYDLYRHLDYVCLLTSIGCPYRCTYCASPLLAPQFMQRDPDSVFREIEYAYSTLGVRNIAFYDDALLVNAANHLEPILKQVIEAGLACFFHTPNGLHARYMTAQLAELLFRSGFRTIRLSLETADTARQQHTGGKVTNAEFEYAVKLLQRAGFQSEHIGVYLFAGLPGQDLRETEDTIRYVHSLGVKASVCEYSPIPGTAAWNILQQHGYLNDDDDPLIHNNSVFLFLKEQYSFDAIQQLKDLLHDLNRRLISA